MLKYAVAYIGAGLTFAVIDTIWLTTMVSRFYRPAIGEILAPKVNLTAAVIFYLISIAGTVYLAIVPALQGGGWSRAAINGAVLGFVAYATYDLTNQATLSLWSTRLTVVDIAWGTVLTTVSALGGYFAARWAEGRFG